MSDPVRINVARDFSETPGPRFIRQGKYSGEAFLRECLLPAFKRAEELGQQLVIDLDGAAGYPPSFLDEAFGGLSRHLGGPAGAAERILRRLDIKSNEEPYLIGEIEDSIRQIRRSA